uniref:Putative farnesoic acid 0-methyl transferase n=2 Tax=Nyssomyia neivai TaxID=330878 RepID=A0A1L8DYN2_9DIPT
MPIEVDTEDKLEYRFYPVTNRIVNFKIRAPNDAHVALTTGPSESDPMLEVFIGGWKNTKSVIRKNRTKPDVVEADTPDVLNAGEFRGFWIRWTTDGIITVGREGEAAAFLSWQDPDNCPFNYVGVCTGWGASGSWIIEGGPEMKTPDNLKYNFLPALEHGTAKVEFKGPSNCHIGLMAEANEKLPLTEVILGGWNNTASVIRVNREAPDRARVDTPNIVTNSHFTTFFIEWRHGHLSVRQGGPQGPLVIEAQESVRFPVRFLAVRTGWGATGKWRIHFDAPQSGQFPPQIAPFPTRRGDTPGGVVSSGGSACWVPASGGSVPDGAVLGGHDGEQLYVARARYGGGLIPGKLVPSHGVCYVAWGGGENSVSDYEVLCGGGSWIPVSGDAIPPNALPGGETEEGEPLFIGRANHEGTITVGKVQPSHGCVYIPYGGEELKYDQYEIFVQ